MSAPHSEIRTLTRLALPMVVAQLGVVGMQIVDMVMAGDALGATALNAVVAGSTWGIGTMILGIGVVMGIDPIVAQAHGAGQGHLAGRALQRGIVVAVLAGICVGFAWWFAEPVLRLARLAPEVVTDGAAYCRAQVFSTVPFLVFMAMRSYLQNRTLMRAPVIVILLANLANVFFNWVFVYGRLGVESMGVEGAGLATGLTRIFMLVTLWAVILAGRMHVEAWVPWSRAALDPRGLWRVVQMGVPVALHVGLEIWAFNLTSLLAGQLRGMNLAAHGIVLKVSAFAFMMALGISVATAARVGNLIGSGEPHQAHRAAWTGLSLGAAVMLCAGAVMYLFREQLPALFVDAAEDPHGAEVIALAATILPLAALFQVSDGLQVVACGVLRGMGTTRPAAVINFLGYYVLALPLAFLLTFYVGGGMGLTGIWWGMTVGLTAIAILFVIWIAIRGPRTAARRMTDDAS